MSVLFRKQSSPQAQLITPGPIVNKPKSHLAILDLLRGIASLGVCVFHYTNGAFTTFNNPVAYFIGHRGALGVEIFFVISGFIIPYALLRSNYQLKDFKKFMIKGFVRIAPPAYIAMIIFIVVCFMIEYFQVVSYPYAIPISWPILLHNLLFSIPFTEYKWINGIFWTLGIEFQFYLLLSLTFPLLRDYKYGILVVGLLLSATNYIPKIPEPTLFHYSTLFTIGIATWLLFEKRISITYFAILLVIFAAIGIKQVTAPPIIMGLITAFCILRVKFSNPITTFLGNISYSLYLLHIIVGCAIELFLIKLIPVVNLTTVLLCVAICLISAIITAYLFHRYIETPFMKLSSRLFRAKNTD